MFRATISLTLLLLARLPCRAEAVEASSLPPLPDPVGFAGPFAGAVGDGALLVAGGANFPDGPPWDGHAKVWHDRVFILEAGRDGTPSWRALDERLHRPLAYGVSLTWRRDGRTSVVCLGGGDANEHVRDAFLLDLEAGRLVRSPLPELPRPLAFHAGVIAKDRIYIAGGLMEPESLASEANERTWVLDLAAPSRAWSRLPDLPGAPRFLAVAALQDGGAFFISGARLVEADDGRWTRDFLVDGWRFDLEKETWRKIAAAPRPLVAAPSPAIPLGSSHFAVLPGDDGSSFGKDLQDAHPGFRPGRLIYHTVTDRWIEGGTAETRPTVTTPTVPWGGGWVVPSGEIRPGVRTNEVRFLRARDAPTGLRALDFLVLCVYFAALIIIGWRMSRHEASTEQYFLGGRRIPWWAAGLSIFATQLSAITFMAIPAISYRTDWVYLVGAAMIAGVAPLVIKVYLPFFRRLDITTAYEYLEARFSASVRVIGSVLFMLMQLGRMGIVLYLPALALSTVTGVDVYASIVVMGVLATVYTVLGGIEAVVWTDVLQVIVLVGGAVLSFVLMIGSLDGGFGEFAGEAAAAGKFHAFESTWSAAELAVWVVLVGRFFDNLVPYTSDQTVVQRYLTTPTRAGAERSIWTNAILSVVASVLFYSVGTALWVFYRAHPERLNPLGRTDDIFPWFIATELPAGVSGLVIAGIFAASMSSLDSSMNSVAAAFTTDIYRKLLPDVADGRALRVARIATVVLGALGTAAAAYMALRGDTSAYDTYTVVIGLFGGGLAGLFFAGMLTRSANAPGMVIGLLGSGLVLYVVSTTTRLHFFLYAGVGILTCVIFGWLASRAFPRARRAGPGTTLREATPTDATPS